MSNILQLKDNMLPNMLVIQKERKRFTAAQYVLIYKGLSLMAANGNLPIAKYRITNNTAVINHLIENQLILPCGDTRKMVSEYYLHKNAKYYVIGPKGFEYMSAFEKLESLFN